MRLKDYVIRANLSVTRAAGSQFVGSGDEVSWEAPYIHIKEIILKCFNNTY